jgi:hypothetical protein
MSGHERPRWSGAFLASLDYATEALRNLDEAAERLLVAECNANAAGARATTQDFAVLGRAVKTEAAAVRETIRRAHEQHYGRRE